MIRSQAPYVVGHNHVTEATIADMLRLRAEGWSLPQLAKKFGLHHTSVLYWIRRAEAQHSKEPVNPKPEDHSWQLDAACRGMGDYPWFGTDDESIGASRRRTRAARAICATCPVVAECLEKGRREQFGIWGGLTRAERRAPRVVYVPKEGERCPRGHLAHRDAAGNKLCTECKRENTRRSRARKKGDSA